MSDKKNTNYDVFLESIKDAGSLAEVLDNMFNKQDIAPWDVWFNDTYCKQCPTVTTETRRDPDSGYYFWGQFQKKECAYCEVHNKCRYFHQLDEVPDIKETIRLWLESEASNQEA